MKSTLFVSQPAALIIGTLLLMAGRVEAQTSAYLNPTALPGNGLQTTGDNSGFPFALGLEFMVNSNVVVSALGAYDVTIGGSGAGFGSSVSVQIYSEASSSFIGQPVTFSGTTGTVVDSYRFQSVASLTLTPGKYMVIASGYGISTAPDWNSVVAGISPSPIQFNTGGGVLTVGSSYYSSDPSGQLEPATVNGGAGALLAAGSFQYSVPGSGPTGTTRTVNTLADDGSAKCLRTLIAASVAGDSINFQAGLTGTIVLNGNELQINRSLTITGPGAMLLTISGNNASRVFNILSAQPVPTVTISGLTISGGVIVGATNVDAASDGGGGQGGGIFNSGALTLMNCTITGNNASGGGGDSFLNGMYSSGNGGEGDGGGVFSSGSLSLINCLVMSNFVSGGASYTNSGNALGGGIYSSGQLSLNNCTFYSNAVDGGYQYDIGPGLAQGYGGGGGIYVTGIGSLINCTVVGNSNILDEIDPGIAPGTGYGGGIYVNGAVTLTSCTISGNSIAQQDGLPYAAGGGGIYCNVAPTLKNTIVSGNSLSTDSGLPGTDVSGSVNSQGFNFIGRTDGNMGWTSIDLLGGTTDSTKLDPQLGSLQNNGGPTPTMALASTSAAVDKGNSFGLTTDQRGFLRPVNYLNLQNPPGDRSDIGAFELVHGRSGLSITFIPRVTPLVNLSWDEELTGPDSQITGPFFGVQNLTPGGSFNAGQWTTFALPVRLVNHRFVAREEIVGGAGGFHRLNSGVASNMIFLPPATTLPATSVTSTGATFNGITTPYGFDTSYWFEYGPDTNYGTSTVTNTSLTVSTNPASLSYPIGGLSPSTAYHYQLVVMDNDGIQLGGDQSFPTLGSGTTASPPTVVTYTATSVTTSSAQLNGIVNPNGADATWWFEYGTDTNYTGGDTTPAVVSASNTNAVPVSTGVVGLAASTLYHCQLVASNSVGTRYGGDVTFTTMSNAAPTVTTLAASSITTNSATLNGSVNANGSSDVAYFQYSTSPFSPFQGGIPVSSYYFPSGNGVLDYSYNVTDLTPNTTYYYLFEAYNFYSVGGALLSFTTGASQAAPTVQTLAASSVTTSSAVLNGSVNPNGGVSSAYFQFGTDTNYGQNFDLGNASSAQNFTTSLGNLPSSTTYHYRIFAFNSVGTNYGADTNFTTATLQPPALVSPGTNSAPGPFIQTLTPAFTWDAASGAQDYDLVILAYPKGNIVFSASVGGTSYSLPGSVLSGGTAYSWYMFSLDYYDIESSPSPSFYFVTPAAPTAITEPATNMVGFAEVLSGYVYPDGVATSVYFQYGTTTNYGSTLPSSPVNIGTTPQTYSLTNNFFVEGSYHYRFVAENSLGTTYGADVPFTTTR